MKRTTLFIDEAVEKDLQAIARRQGRKKAAVTRDAIARYVAQEKIRIGASLSIVAMERSGRSDTAETHEDILWSGLGPHGPLDPKGREGAGATPSRKARRSGRKG